ncbi:MAG: GDSL-type esterase/lipase family protein [Shewanella sp.]
MFFTQNPIGSSATEDLQDNAISFDYAMNSPAALWQDRFGKQHKTVQQALKDVGFKPAGFDFVSGGTLGIGDRDKCVFYPTDGYWYNWNGKLPYVVPANSSPTPGGKKGWGVVTRDEHAIAREALRRTYQEVGLVLVPGSFENGGVLNTVTDILLEEKTGKCYSWTGRFPKIVGYGSLPTSEVEFKDCSAIRNGDKMSASSPTNNSLVINPNEARYWNIPVTEAIKNITIEPVLPETPKELRLIFTQPESGAYDIVLPANVRKPKGSTFNFIFKPGVSTHIALKTINAGKSWEIETFNNFSNSILPLINSERSVFETYGNSISGWAALRGAVTSANNYTRLTKNVAEGQNSGMSKPLVFSPDNKDFILYGKIKSSKLNPTDTSTIWFLNGSKELSLWLGNTDGGAGAAYANGASSLTVNDGARKTAVLANAGELDYDVTAVEFAIQFDNKFGQTSCWFKQSDGRWKLRGRVKNTWFAPNPLEIQLYKGTQSPINSWVEFEYIMLCTPNIIAIGDSICEGKTLFSPNSSLGLNDDNSTWQRHCVLYPDLKNNLIVNKGVGGESSTQILNRISEVVTQNPQFVLLHASTNDLVKSVTIPERTVNIQKTVDALTVSGETSVVLLNGMYGTVSSPDNSQNNALRNYMTNWWQTESDKVMKLEAKIDIMEPLIDPNGFMQTGLTSADGLHPNILGYEKVGHFINEK